MKISKLGRAALATGCLSLLVAPVPLAMAGNITINDTISGSGSWAGASEIHEVEPGCVGSHVWDLEAFTLQANRLSMIGGYNFRDGYEGTTSGSIFFDVNGDAKYGSTAVGLSPSGNGNQSVLNPFGYDYAAVLNFANNTFELYSLTATSPLLTGYYGQNAGSNPWSYNWQSDPNRNRVAGGTITYQSGLGSTLVNSQFGVDPSASGSSHNVVSLDLPSLLADQDILAHFTMSCGNDNLIGAGRFTGSSDTPNNPVPDAGATGLMLGLGIGALGLFRRSTAS